MFVTFDLLFHMLYNIFRWLWSAYVSIKCDENLSFIRA